jgi:hypothetical protein
MADAVLITLLLPLYDGEGRAFPRELYEKVRRELTERFGGLTAFTRAPAEGLWRDEGRTERDDIVVLEVMADELDRSWWSGYRADLEARFMQDEIVIRAQSFERL